MLLSNSLVLVNRGTGGSTCSKLWTLNLEPSVSKSTLGVDNDNLLW